MDEFEKTTLVRTKMNVLRNLDRINDAVESSEFPLGDHMVLDDIKDSVKILKCLKELGATEAVKAAAKIPGIA